MKALLCWFLGHRAFVDTKARLVHCSRCGKELANYGPLD